MTRTTRRVRTFGVCLSAVRNPSGNFAPWRNVLIYDNRSDVNVIRQLSVTEMCNISSLADEARTLLTTAVPDELACKYIANAIPGGMLQTIYSAILDHAVANDTLGQWRHGRVAAYTAACTTCFTTYASANISSGSVPECGPASQWACSLVLP